MRILMLAVALAGMSACASSGTTPDAAAPAERAQISRSGELTRLPSGQPNAISAPVEIAPEHAWKLLRAVYDSLGIPVGRVDAAARIVGNAGVRVRRRLGTVSLTQYLDCGSTQGGPNAETYEIHLVLTTQVQPGTGGNSVVSTTVDAMARPVTFSADFFPCTSKGRLETRIVDVLRKLAGS